MKSKVKKRCKQVLTGLLALSMLCGILPQNAVSVSAATTAKTKVSSYGRLGNVDVGSKTKTDNLCIVTMFFSTGILIPGMGIRHLISISGMTRLSKTETKCSLTMQRLSVFMSMTAIGQKRLLFLGRHLSGRYQREILLKQI